MTNVFLIRVGMDSTYGGFVSPIFPDNSYVFVPIPDLSESRHQENPNKKGLKTYSEIKTNSKLPLTDFLPKDKIKVVGEKISDLKNIKVHNDPEFISNTYGEKKEKIVVYSNVKNFQKGDFIIFYATFFKCLNYDFKYCDYKLSKLEKIQRNNKEFYIVAFLKLKYTPIYKHNYIDFKDEISNNAHYLRGDFEKHDESFILKGTDESRWINPIRLDDGIHIRGNYFMKKEFSKYKMFNKNKRGINRCYCNLEEDIIPIILENNL